MVNNSKIEYFLPGSKQDSDRRASAEITKWLQKWFLRCFQWNRMFWWEVFIAGKTRQQTIPGAPRHVAYALQKPFKEKLEWFQQQNIITQLGVDLTEEWWTALYWYPNPMEKSDYAWIW